MCYVHVIPACPLFVLVEEVPPFPHTVMSLGLTPGVDMFQVVEIRLNTQS